MKRYITSLALSFAFVTSCLAFVSPSVHGAGFNPFEGACPAGSSTGSGAASGVGGSAAAGSGTVPGSSAQTICGASDPSGGDFNSLIKNVINTILVVLGMIAVIMIVVGGIRYTTSNGESAQITSAKNTILYAVVGLVVAVLAYAIVNFVLAAFGAK